MSPDRRRHLRAALLAVAAGALVVLASIAFYRLLEQGETPGPGGAGPPVVAGSTIQVPGPTTTPAPGTPSPGQAPPSPAQRQYGGGLSATPAAPSPIPPRIR